MFRCIQIESVASLMLRAIMLCMFISQVKSICDLIDCFAVEFNLDVQDFYLILWALVYFPVTSRKEIAPFLKSVAAAVNELHVVDVDIPLSTLIKDEQKLDQVVLGREFHVSLGRTVPIRVHQRESLVAMLRTKLQSHKR